MNLTDVSKLHRTGRSCSGVWEKIRKREKGNETTETRDQEEESEAIAREQSVLECQSISVSDRDSEGMEGGGVDRTSNPPGLPFQEARAADIGEFSDCAIAVVMMPYCQVQ